MTAAAALADREFALVAACCRWPRDAAAMAETARLAADIDQSRLLRVVRRHRVAALVDEALRPVAERFDPALLETLRVEAAAARLASLALAAESLRLHRLLADAGIGHLFVKGEGLGLLAYGRLGLKAARDIDLLHAPEDFDRVGTCMAAAGYRQIEPSLRLTPADRRLWLKLHKDSVWRHSGTGLVAELHYRLTLSPRLLAGINAASPTIEAELTRGQAVPLLNPTDHYVYLCVHGALSGWARLKWLADLGALLNARGTPPVEALHAAAERQRVGGASHLALLLLERLFARPLGVSLPEDRAVLRAADRAIAGMTGIEGDREPRAGAIAILRQQASVRRLTSLPRQRWALLPLTLVSFRDRAALRLPRALSPLYWLIRLPSAVGRGLLARLG